MLLRGFGIQYFGVSVGLLLASFCSANPANAQQGQIGDAVRGTEQAAQDDPELQGPALIQQASYLIGQQIFNDFARDQVDINVEALIQGIKDAAEAKPSTIPAERAQAVMMAFAKSVQAKQQQLLQQMADTNLKAGQEFLKENALKPGIKQLENGVQYEVLQSGNGPSPTETDTVTVHYTGTFIDGTVFDSSVTSGKPATLQLTRVIEGWTKTIPRMKVGDKWRIFIPSNLAYRETGQAPVIQPNQTLIFEIELLDVKPR